MLLEHRGKAPNIADSAYVAPNATICGDVTLGQNTSVLFGAVITAEGGPVLIGNNCIIMENSVLRGTMKHPLRIGDNVLVGPHAMLSGCAVEDNVFIGSGARIFNAATLGTGAEVRINGIVHLKTALPPGATVPIGWIAVGDPAEILPPGDHDKIWSIQEPLNFPLTVFGIERRPNGQTMMPEVARRYTRSLASHKLDHILGDE
jgi:carbonic anhydrase/acetyltransferase-like protein (isoleucine patch superfamily)